MDEHLSISFKEFPVVPVLATHHEPTRCCLRHRPGSGKVRTRINAMFASISHDSYHRTSGIRHLLVVSDHCDFMGIYVGYSHDS
jgi:hypothetical protein